MGVEDPRAVPKVVIADDETEARLVLEPGEQLGEHQALVHVARRGVRHGLLHEALAGVRELIGPVEIVVARAVRLSAGADGRIETPLGNTAFSVRPAIDASGRARFPDLPLPAVVRPGDVIAVKVAPVPAHAGRTVTGKDVGGPPRTVREAPLRAGLGTKLSEDGTLAIATVEGNPGVVDGMAVVRPELKVPGDLDGTSGDTRFGGNVFVAGDVHGPVEVLAAGDITVLGDVVGATLTAGGRVVVHGTIGRGTRVEATTDVVARAIAHAAVRCAGAVTVREDLEASTVDGAREVAVLREPAAPGRARA